MLTGCREEEEIRRYKVDKPHVLQKINPGVSQNSNGGPEAPVGVPSRMLAAIVPYEKQAWFFKVTGPIPEISKHADAFKQFVQSVTFEGGADAKPQWDVPEGWKQQPGSEMRFATLQLPTSGQPLELAVSSLALREGEDLQQYILMNVNRWRNQMQLPPITKQELPERTEELELKGTIATLADLEGLFSGGMGMQAPFAGRRPDSTPIQPMPEAANSSLSYDVPEGWKPGRAGGFRKAAFNIEGESGKAEVTVIDLSRQSGDLLSNVNRWRGEIGLGPTTQSEVEKQVQQLDVGMLKGELIYMVGPEDASRREATIAVIVPHDEKTWFIKLRGDAALVEEERERFEQFAGSIKFTQD